MTPTLWSIAGGIVAVLCEYLYRTLPGPWHHYLYLWIPMQVFIGYVVYRIVQAPGTSLLAAFVVWSCATLTCRVLLCVVVLQDKVALGTWIALALIILARISQQVWK